jgi:hypothetical protein
MSASLYYKGTGVDFALIGGAFFPALGPNVRVFRVGSWLNSLKILFQT